MMKIMQRGTIIAFHVKLNLILYDTMVDERGRSIILDCTIFKHCITLKIHIDLSLMYQPLPSLEVLSIKWINYLTELKWLQGTLM